MPEVITKYPDALITVLKGGGARCGPGQPQRILTRCPPARFCSTPTGEVCVYTPDQIDQMTQIQRKDLCATAEGPASNAGPSAAAVAPSDLLAAGGVIALAIAAAMSLRRRGARARSPLDERNGIDPAATGP